MVTLVWTCEALHLNRCAKRFASSSALSKKAAYPSAIKHVRLYAGLDLPNARVRSAPEKRDTQAAIPAVSFIPGRGRETGPPPIENIHDRHPDVEAPSGPQPLSRARRACLKRAWRSISTGSRLLSAQRSSRMVMLSIAS